MRFKSTNLPKIDLELLDKSNPVRNKYKTKDNFDLISFKYIHEAGYFWLQVEVTGNLEGRLVEVYQIGGKPVNLEKINDLLYRYLDPEDETNESRYFQVDVAIDDTTTKTKQLEISTTPSIYYLSSAIYPLNVIETMRMSGAGVTGRILTSADLGIRSESTDGLSYGISSILGTFKISLFTYTYKDSDTLEVDRLQITTSSITGILRELLKTYNLNDKLTYNITNITGLLKQSLILYTFYAPENMQFTTTAISPVLLTVSNYYESYLNANALDYISDDSEIVTYKPTDDINSLRTWEQVGNVVVTNSELQTNANKYSAYFNGSSYLRTNDSNDLFPLAEKDLNIELVVQPELHTKSLITNFISPELGVSGSRVVDLIGKVLIKDSVTQNDEGIITTNPDDKLITYNNPAFNIVNSVTNWTIDLDFRFTNGTIGYEKTNEPMVFYSNTNLDFIVNNTGTTLALVLFPSTYVDVGLRGRIALLSDNALLTNNDPNNIVVSVDANSLLFNVANQIDTNPHRISLIREGNTLHLGIDNLSSSVTGTRINTNYNFNSGLNGFSINRKNYGLNVGNNASYYASVCYVALRLTHLSLNRFSTFTSEDYGKLTVIPKVSTVNTPIYLFRKGTSSSYTTGYWCGIRYYLDTDSVKVFAGYGDGLIENITFTYHFKEFYKPTHVKVLYSLNKVTVYLDGVAYFSKNTSELMMTNTTPFTLGADEEDLGRTFKGVIDNFKAYYTNVNLDLTSGLLYQGWDFENNSGIYPINTNVPWYYLGSNGTVSSTPYEESVGINVTDSVWTSIYLNDDPLVFNNELPEFEIGLAIRNPVSKFSGKANAGTNSTVDLDSYGASWEKPTGNVVTVNNPAGATFGYALSFNGSSNLGKALTTNHQMTDYLRVAISNVYVNSIALDEIQVILDTRDATTGNGYALGVKGLGSNTYKYWLNVVDSSSSMNVYKEFDRVLTTSTWNSINIEKINKTACVVIRLSPTDYSYYKLIIPNNPTNYSSVIRLGSTTSNTLFLNGYLNNFRITSVTNISILCTKANSSSTSGFTLGLATFETLGYVAFCRNDLTQEVAIHPVELNSSSIWTKLALRQDKEKLSIVINSSVSDTVTSLYTSNTELLRFFNTDISSLANAGTDTTKYRGYVDSIYIRSSFHPAYVSVNQDPMIIENYPDISSKVILDLYAQPIRTNRLYNYGGSYNGRGLDKSRYNNTVRSYGQANKSIYNAGAIYYGNGQYYTVTNHQDLFNIPDNMDFQIDFDMKAMTGLNGYDNGQVEILMTRAGGNGRYNIVLKSGRENDGRIGIHLYPSSSINSEHYQYVCNQTLPGFYQASTISSLDYLVSAWIGYANATYGGSYTFSSYTGTYPNYTSINIIRLSDNDARTLGGVSLATYFALYSDKKVNDNLWHTIAIKRKGTSVEFWIDNVLDKTHLNVTESIYSSTSTNSFIIGGNNSTYYFNGYLRNVRFIRDATIEPVLNIRGTTTPPIVTAPTYSFEDISLTPETTALLRFEGIEGSTNIIDDKGNTWNNGGGSYITTSSPLADTGSLTANTYSPNNKVYTSASLLPAGTTPWQFDCLLTIHDQSGWSYDSSGTIRTIFAKNNNSGAGEHGFYLYTSDRSISYLRRTGAGAPSDQNINSGPLNLNTPYRVTLSYDGVVLRLFIDSKLKAMLATPNGFFPGTSEPYSLMYSNVPNYTAAQYGFNGKIDNVRTISNKCLNYKTAEQYDEYLTTYLPFDGPNNGTVIKDGGTVNKTWTTSGNAVISTGQTFNSISSLYLPASSNTDYISTISNSSMDLRNGDFTISFEVYPTSWYDSNSAPIIAANDSSFTSGTVQNYCVIGIDNQANNRVIGLAQVISTGVEYLSSTVAISLNTITKIFITFNNSTKVGKLFINGILNNQYTFSTNNFNFSYGGTSIGRSPYGSQYRGYIKNLRVYKGIAIEPDFNKYLNDALVSKLTFESNTFLDSVSNSLWSTNAGTPTIGTTNSRIDSKYNFVGNGSNSIKRSLDLGTGPFVVAFDIMLQQIPEEGYGFAIMTYGGGTEGAGGFAVESFKNNGGPYAFVLRNAYSSMTSVSFPSNYASLILNSWIPVRIVIENSNTAYITFGSYKSANINLSLAAGARDFIIGTYSGDWLQNKNYLIDNFRIYKGISNIDYEETKASPYLTYLDFNETIKDTTSSINWTGSYVPLSKDFRNNVASFKQTTDSYLTCTPTSSLNFGTSDFTINFDVMFFNLLSDRISTLLSSGTSSDNYSLISIFNVTGSLGHHLTLETNDFGLPGLDSTLNNTIYNFKIIRKGNNIYSFINGLLTNSKVHAGNIDFTKNSVTRIGQATYVTETRRSLDGLLDKFYIKNVAEDIAGNTAQNCLYRYLPLDKNTNDLGILGGVWTNNNVTFTTISGKKCASFNGTSSNITYNPTRHSFNFGTPTGNSLDFSISFDFYPNDVSATRVQSLLGTVNGAAGQFMDFTIDQDSVGANADTLYFYTSIGPAAPVRTTNKVVYGQWNTVIFKRVGSTLTLTLNGIDTVATYTGSIDFSSGGTQIGRSGSNSNWFSGYITNFVMIKNQTSLPSNYNVYKVTDLSFDTSTNIGSNLLEDKAYKCLWHTSNNTFNTDIRSFTKFKEIYALYFDGSSYLTTNQNSTFNKQTLNFSTSDFIIDFWINPIDTGTSTNGYTSIFASANTSNSTTTDWLATNKYIGWGNSVASDNNRTNKIFLDSMNSNVTNSARMFTSNSNVYANIWTRVTYVRQGNILNLYLNSNLDATYTLSSEFTLDFTANYSSLIGSHGVLSSTNFYKGYIGPIKMYKGTSDINNLSDFYTTDYTKYVDKDIHLKFENNFNDETGNSVWNNTSGLVTFSNTVKGKDGAYSANFTSTNSTAVLNCNTELMNFGTGDFTINIDAYKPSVQSQSLYGIVLSSRINPTQAGDVLISFMDQSDLYFSFEYCTSSSTSNNIGIGTGGYSLQNWYNIKVTRKNGIAKIYINDVLKENMNLSNIINFNRTNSITMGYGLSGQNKFTGYLDNFYTYKGYAEVIENTSHPIINLPCKRDLIDVGTKGILWSSTGGVTYASGGGIVFNGIDSNIETTADQVSNSLNGLGSYYIEMTLKCSGANSVNYTAQRLIGRGDTSDTLNFSTSIIYNSTTELVTGFALEFYVTHGGTAQGISISGLSIPKNQIFNIKVISKNGVVTIYIDDVLKTTANMTITGNTTVSGKYFFGLNGADNSNDYDSRFNGTLYDLKLYNYTNEVSETYNYHKIVDIPFTNSNESYLIKDKANRIVWSPQNIDNTNLSVYQGRSCVRFNGTDEYIITKNNPQLDLSTSDFVIEFWINPQTTSNLYGTIISNGQETIANLSYIQLREDLSIRVRGNSGSILNTPASIYTLNTWTKVKLVRTSLVLELYINDLLITTQTLISTDAFNFNTNNYTNLGRNNWDGADGYFNGYLSDFKIIKGSSDTQYLTDVETTEEVLGDYLSGLTFEKSNTIIIDNSTTTYNIPMNSVDSFYTTWLQRTPASPVVFKEFTPYKTAMYFNGNSALYSSNISTRLGLSPFTVELNIQLDSGITSSYDWYICSWGKDDTMSTLRSYALVVTSLGAIRWGFGGSIITTATGVITVGQKYHVAVTRDANYILRIFVNGSKVLETPNNYNYCSYQATTYDVGYSTNPSQEFGVTTPGNSFYQKHYLYLGCAASASSNNNYAFKGYIDNFHLINGTCKYISNFLPEETIDEGLKIITKSLLNFDISNGSNPTTITDSWDNSIIWTNTGVSIENTGTTLFRPYRARFTTTSNRLVSSTNNIFKVGSNFTIDLILTPTQTAADTVILQMLNGGITTYKGLLVTQPTGSAASLTISLGNSATTSGFNYNINTGTNSFISGNTYHLRIVRNLTKIFVWYNGAYKGHLDFGMTAIDTDTKVILGNNDQNTKGYNGYIEQFRLLNGVATNVYAIPAITEELK